MNKPGRNEPCHCGSGKKYKKCCIEKDTANATLTLPEDKQKVEEWEFEDEELYTNNGEEESDYNKIADDDYNEFEDDDDEKYLGEVDDIVDSSTRKKDLALEKITNKAYPVLSAEDEKLVDKWWDGLDYKKEPGEIKKYLEDFMHAHPQLVENLGLEHEVLFELGAKYNKAGKTGDYIQFLLRVRKEFPGAYERSGGYYDSNIISWLIGQNRKSEIDDYLGYLKQYPVEFIEQLFEVCHLLEATDNTIPLISLVSATFERVTSSSELFGGNEILGPLISKTAAKYIRPDLSGKDVGDFMDELSKVIAPVSVDKNETTLNYWKTRFGNILRPFTNWPVDIPKKKSQIEERYEAISHNFSRYLLERLNISWITAFYYSTHIANYFEKNIELTNGKIKKQFDFSEKNIDRIVVALSKKMLGLDCTKSLSILTALYYFAGYLQECGNISEEEKLTIQKDCTKLYNQVYPKLEKEFTEAACFKTFPLFAQHSS